MNCKTQGAQGKNLQQTLYCWDVKPIPSADSKPGARSCERRGLCLNNTVPASLPFAVSVSNPITCPITKAATSLLTEVNPKMRQINSIKCGWPIVVNHVTQAGWRVSRADKALLLCNNVSTFLLREVVVKTLE